MARGMRVMTVFLTSEEMIAVLEAASDAGLKPYAWARRALVAAARRYAPVNVAPPSEPSQQTPVWERMGITEAAWRGLTAPAAEEGTE